MAGIFTCHDKKTRNHPHVSPLRARNGELQISPKALVITVENNHLPDEGEVYACKLMDADVLVATTRYDGMIHDSVLLNAIRESPEMRAASPHEKVAYERLQFVIKRESPAGSKWGCDHRHYMESRTHPSAQQLISLITTHAATS